MRAVSMRRRTRRTRRHPIRPRAASAAGRESRARSRALPPRPGGLLQGSRREGTRRSIDAAARLARSPCPDTADQTRDRVVSAQPSGHLRAGDSGLFLPRAHARLGARALQRAAPGPGRLPARVRSRGGTDRRGAPLHPPGRSHRDRRITHVASTPQNYNTPGGPTRSNHPGDGPDAPRTCRRASRLHVPGRRRCGIDPQPFEPACECTGHRSVHYREPRAKPFNRAFLRATHHPRWGCARRANRRRCRRRNAVHRDSCSTAKPVRRRVQTPKSATHSTQSPPRRGISRSLANSPADCPSNAGKLCVAPLTD